MRRALLGVLLMLSLSLAGCLAPSSAGWGDGGVSVSTDGMNATVVSDLTPSQTTVDEVMLAGCDTEGTIGDAANQTGLITIEGHLAASTLYTSHGEDMRGLASGVTAAVILEAMSYGSAEAVPNGQGARIPVKNWAEPLNPSTGSGQSTSQRTVNVEDVDSDSNEPWFVLGLLPASEHIAAGFGAVDDVHQPIRIRGLHGQERRRNEHRKRPHLWSEVPIWEPVPARRGQFEQRHVLRDRAQHHPAGRLRHHGRRRGRRMGDGRRALARSWRLCGLLPDGGRWRWGGLYVVSSKRVKGVAASQAKVLLGKENMAKAETARKAPKRKAPEPARAAPEPKKEKKPKKKEDSSIGGFDLDAALSTKGSSASSKPERSSRGGSSVVVTEEASSMAAQTKAASSASSSASSPPWEAPVSTTERRSGGVTPMGGAPTRSGPPQRSAPPQRSEPAAEQPTVRRRRAVRKAAPEPEPEPEPAPAPAEEEEFSDFSF